MEYEWLVVKSILSLHQRKKTKNAEHREFSLKIKCTAKVTSQIRKHFNLVIKLQQKLNDVLTQFSLQLKIPMFFTKIFLFSLFKGILHALANRSNYSNN